MVLACKTCNCSPRLRAAACRFFDCVSALGLIGLRRSAMAVASGINWCRRSSRFGPSSTFSMLTPVRLPPGRLRLATSPVPTGSTPLLNTIGIVAVAALAARGETLPPVAAITATWRRTSSAARAGNRSYLSSAQRYSMSTFCPST